MENKNAPEGPIDEKDEIACRFVEVLKATEPAPLIIAAAFELIEVVLCHLDQSHWDVAEELVNTATTVVLKRMRAGDYDEAGRVH